MAKTKISEYDSTAANNTDIDGINIAEGMAPSNVNNAIREQMAHLKDGLGAGTPVFLDQTNNRVGVGTDSPDGQLHLFTSDASISPDADADDLIIEANGASGITIGSSASSVGSIRFADSGSPRAGMIYYSHSSNFMRFDTGATERMRIDSNGTFLVGKTTDSAGTAGFKVETEGDTYITAEGGDGRCVYLNRLTSDGTIAEFSKDDTTVGAVGSYSGDVYVVNAPFDGAGAGLRYNSGFPNILPCNGGGADRDNAIDLGHSSVRFDDVYATNGTIQTSDEREKQQIASLTDAEMTAAKAISKLFKTFKWNDSVAENGDNARTHAGVIAQQVETAMSDAGLNAGSYAFFINTTWWETETEVAAVEANEEKLIEAQDAYTRTDTYDTQEEAPEGATERNRKGIRYPELLAFIGAATEQRLTSIEARLDALEG